MENVEERAKPKELAASHKKNKEQADASNK